MESNSFFILFIIFLALVFDFTNGFHDAANSIATIVATNVLTPFQAVAWAAFFNFIGFLVFKLAVATNIGTGLIQPNIVTPYLIFATLISAILWNLITWYYGLPSSSSHALIGGLAGTAFATGGLDVIEFYGFAKVFAAIILSPFLGIIISLGLTLIITRVTKHCSEKNSLRWFKRFQLLSSAILSLTHGGNDAQKTMGIIAILLYSSAWIGDQFYVPFWVVISCHLVIALGTLTGGWRIVNTMGKEITDLNSLKGCCAEVGAASVIYAATELGVPISTTHTVTGAIAGVGLSQRFLGIHWGVLRKIFFAWLLTIPMTAFIGTLLMLLPH